jgi:cell division GTPase FtsZ
MSDNFDVEVPDIPLPEEEKTIEIEDTFKGAFKFAIIGAGQGGGRLAQTFWNMGYKRTAVINTSEQDLATIDMPDDRKLLIGTGGAGKNPAVAASLIKDKKEDVLDFMRRSFGPGFDRVFCCASAAGGTGSGTLLHLIDVAIELQQSLKTTSQKVGVVLALPKISEGQKLNANAYNVLRDVFALVEKGIVSPLVLVDNEKISTLYPKLAVDPFWDTANRSLISLFHLFNLTSIRESRYTSFDPSDLKTILDSGLITFGATPVENWKDATGISFAIRNSLKKNILSGGVSIETGNTAGAMIIGSEEVLGQVPQVNLDTAFEQLTRILKPGNTVHRGIYRGNKPGLVVYTIIGGLGRPTDKLAELRKFGNVIDSAEPWPK